MKKARLEFPWPPSLNHYRKWNRKTGVSYKTRETKDYIARVSDLLVLARARGVKSFGKARLSVTLHIHPPDLRGRDLDNITKVLYDCLGAKDNLCRLYDDDSQIDEVHKYRMQPHRPDGKIIMTIEEIIPCSTQLEFTMPEET